MVDGLTLGIDFGTSAVKVVALRGDGTVAAHASSGYETFKPAPDRAEQEPEDWWCALSTAAASVMAEIDPLSVIAAGLSGQLNGIVLIDADGAALGRCLIWLDQRCGDEVAELERSHAETLAAKVSSPTSPIAVLPKLQWLARHEPARMHRARHVFQVKDYILWRLTGAVATDANEASATLMMDLASRQWDPALVTLSGLAPGHFSPIRASTEIVGRVTAEASAATGLPRGLSVVPGSGDTGALGVGCGAFAAGTAAVTLGTAGHIVASVPNQPPALVPGLWRMAHVTPDRELWLGLIPAGGLSIAWLRNLGTGFAGRPFGFDDLERLVQATEPGSGAAIFLPFLEGAGTPWNDPSRFAAFAGLNVTHGAGHLVRAVYEGVAFNIRACLESFEVAGVGLERVHLAEGGAQSPAWCQIIADVLNREVRVVAERDTSATGAAILARASAEPTDLAAVVERSVRIARVHKPNPAMRDRIDLSWKRFQQEAGRTN